MKQPLFTIITCTYNSEKYLTRNILSVASQSFLNYEHLFIDGNSTDKTQALIKKYQDFDKRVRVISQKPQGISSAFNLGIKNAQGTYLIFLNSDDGFIDKDVLSDTKNFLFSNSFPDWIYGQIQVVEISGKKVGIFPNRQMFKQSNSYLLKFFNFIPHQAVFIKKSLFSQFGFFDETLKTKMDPDLWFRIKNKTRWTFFPRLVSNFTIHSNAASSGVKFKKESIRDWQKVQRKYMNVVEFSFAILLNMIIEKFNKVRR